MKGLGVFLAVVAVAVFTCALLPSADAKRRPRVAYTYGGKIAFTRTGVGIMVLDASGEGQLTSGGSDDQAAWSPNGTQFAFTRIDETGTKWIWLESDWWRSPSQLRVGNRPNYSPDGTRLVYLEAHELYVHDFATGLAKAIPVLPGVDKHHPTWAATPSGEWVYFKASGSGLYRMHPAGRGLERVVANALASHPQVSPDGTRLVYDDGISVWVADADGANPRSIGPGVQPTWVGDDRVAYAANRDLWTRPAAGGVAERLTSSGKNESPEWHA